MSRNETTHLTFVEFQRRDAAKRDVWRRREAVKVAVEHGARALRGRLDDHSRRELRKAVVDVLAPALLGRDGRELARYTDMLGDREGFDPLALGRLYAGRASDDDLARCYHSLTVIAEYHGIVGDVANYAEAWGFATRLGRMWLRYDMDVGDEVQLATRSSGDPKTLYCGKTGRGKSSSLGAAVADRYAAGYKVLDVVDTDEYENAVVDIPQKQGPLRDARRDLGHPADYTHPDADVPEPRLEVLVPLTPETADMSVPLRVDPDDDERETVVRPFTVPAESLDKTTLVKFLSSMVSKQQETSLRTAYNALPPGANLRDLAEEIADRDDLEDKYQKRVLRLLEDLVRSGFIRDRDDPFTLDWPTIFNDTETVTAFSVAPLSDPTDRLMVLAYLFSQIYAERRKRNRLPRAVLVARELHEVAPHRNETSDDRRAEALQYAIGVKLSKMLKKNRHLRLEVLADTQDIKDLKKGVRSRFSRIVAFQQPSDSLDECFSVLGARRTDAARRHLPSERGKAMVVGDHGVDGLEYLSPVQMAPPPWHHFDVDEHSSGFLARTAYLDEELGPAPWDDDGEAPEELQFSAKKIARDGDGIDATPEHYSDFLDECIAEGDDDLELAKDVLLDVFNEWAVREGVEPASTKASLARFLNRAHPDGEPFRSRSPFYEGVTLTERGTELLDDAVDDLDSAAEVVDDRSD